MRNNLSRNDHYSQRNNAFDPLNACMPTAYGTFLDGNKIKYSNPSGLPSDDFFMSLLRSDAAKHLRDKKYPHLSKYPPNEIHGMYHYFLEPLICGGKISDFRTDLTYDKIIEILDKGQIIMTSGSFPSIPGHAFCFIGYDDNGFLRLSDPYGDYRTGYSDKNGYDVKMNPTDFEKYVKPGPVNKWGRVLI